MGVGVFRHDIGDVLEHLQGEHIQPGTALSVLAHALFQSGEVLVDVPVELQPVDAGDGGAGLERHLLAIESLYQPADTPAVDETDPAPGGEV